MIGEEKLERRHIDGELGDAIHIVGARENNLKNVSVSIPLYKLCCVCGVSGSGKSSLLYDVIYQESQRRFIDTISPYARQFMGDIRRPNVDKIEYLPPVIVIRQKTGVWNPRSTVGTTTQIYDLLRLLYARCGIAYSPVTGKPMQKMSQNEIVEHIAKNYAGERISIYSMVVRNRKGHYRDLFERMLQKGFMYARIDGIKREIVEGLMLSRHSYHTIEIMIDTFTVNNSSGTLKRIEKCVNMGFEMGDVITVERVVGVSETLNVDSPQGSSKKRKSKESKDISYYSKEWFCPESGMSVPPADPLLFAFNNAYGYCPECLGIGAIEGIDHRFIFNGSGWILDALPEDLPLRGHIRDTIAEILKKNRLPEDANVGDIPSHVMFLILYGESGEEDNGWRGIMDIPQVAYYYRSVWKSSDMYDVLPVEFYTCPYCRGKRLRKEALWFKIKGMDISEVSKLEIYQLKEWVNSIDEFPDNTSRIVAEEIKKDMNKKLDLMIALGLDYLTLDRGMSTLSGGESQNVRIVAQLGSGLRDVLYLLDEPTVGMHIHNTKSLVRVMKELVQEGNTVVVVEHEPEVIKNADWIIEMGPGGGDNGGNIIFSGSVDELMKHNTPTAISIKSTYFENIREKSYNFDKFIVLEGASGHNLKNITVEFPIGKLICVCGVSGSGKSSLIVDTLYPALLYHLEPDNITYIGKALPYKKLKGIEEIKRVVLVDQSPIGRTPRSNVATYTGAFDIIRKLFSSTTQAQALGYPPGHFSFNVKGGRCEECKGAGKIKIEMRYLPDIYITCPSCNGKRFYPHVLNIKYKGKTIYDVLEMKVSDAYQFFHNIPSLRRILGLLISTGLDYLKLGELSSELSGGESQRIKLVYELAKKRPQNTVYILDEPTIGLHNTDLSKLIKTLDALVKRNNTVIVIEHNLEVIASADYVIELGPGGGTRGGHIIARGTPEQIAANPNSITGKYLKEFLNLQSKGNYGGRKKQRGDIAHGRTTT